MSRIYICVYRFDDDGWPYDRGDDPSFRCSEEYRNRGGVLTWGVCRADVRNAIQENDVVVFFGAKRGSEPTLYRFAGFATVARKISQAEIWWKDELTVYRNYRNLLIRPAKGGFEHYEPAFVPPSERKPHKDWLWRIVDRRRHRREELKPMEARDVVASGSVRFGTNYVLFRPEGVGTLILATPPLVAEASESGQEELWRRDAVARDVYEAVLSNALRQHLRTQNVQRPHRHMTIRDADTADWLSRLQALCNHHSLTGRHAFAGRRSFGRLTLDRSSRGGPSGKSC